MSRTLRSALTLAQSVPGPSRPTAVLRQVPASRLAAPTPVAARSFFNLPLPQSWRRSKKTPEAAAETPAPAPPAAAAKAAPAASATDIRVPADAVGTVSEVREYSSAGVGKAQGSAEQVATSEGGLFDDIVDENNQLKTKPKVWNEHAYKSAFHKMSHRKLNAIGRQVAGLPIDEAVLQLAFGEKRAGRTWVKSTLALARDHAEAKGLRRSRLVVAETWVSKGPKLARVDIKGRGRMGIKHHPSARIHFVLREGKTHDEKTAAERAKTLSRVRSAGVVREDGKLRRKMNHAWGW